jgi:hypothetical protein
VWSEKPAKQQDANEKKRIDAQLEAHVIAHACWIKEKDERIGEVCRRTQPESKGARVSLRMNWRGRPSGMNARRLKKNIFRCIALKFEKTERQLGIHTTPLLQPYEK